MNLKRLILCVVAAFVMATLGSCRDQRKAATDKKVVIIGFDGMDPRLCIELMDVGRMPNLNRMRQAGGFKPLGTSIPPQSPVAWSNFITGAGPGVHGIFDFIHRDPTQQVRPYYSAAETHESEEGWHVGDHTIPLTFPPFNHNPTQTLLRREGKPFWDFLDEAGIETRIYDIPANYPPSESKHGHMCCLSGMGVPDLLGSYGTYQVFSEGVVREVEEGGGMRKPLTFRDGAADAEITGPMNTAMNKPRPATIPMRIFRDTKQDATRIDVQDQSILLKRGEWSDWLQVKFELEMPSFMPNSHASGIVRFYLQEVSPTYRLYMTPVNIDPTDPGEQRVSEPPDFVATIADDLGLFYTAGFQEDHKALSNEVFTDAEYHRQAEHVLTERLNLLDHAMDTYETGLLFFYFSSTDLQSHMYWWRTDAKHPTRSVTDARRYNAVIEKLYERMDEVVGRVVEEYGDNSTILVMSDHGFCNFRRQFNLNTWLRETGYIQPRGASGILSPSINWTRTKAYGLGLNGLYLNLAGRERDGIVTPPERDALMDELTTKLLAVRDPLDNRPVIKRVYRREEVYQGPFVEHAPDLIIGYHRDFRASWATTLGDMADAVITDNDSAWSADHCIAADEVPGVVFSNRRIAHDAPALIDIAPTVLAEFGLSVPESMTGSNIFETHATLAEK